MRAPARVRASSRRVPGIPRVWTVGHSTRPWAEFIALLRAHDIELVVDVRRFPGSRRQPQFAQAQLAPALARERLEYLWLPALGGRRRPQPDSRATGWRHPAFRAYADHMDSPEFADGLQELLIMSGGLRTVIMCAELLWWRCHRRLVADVLTWLGGTVTHIRDARHAEPHRLRAPARVVAGQLSYRLPRRRSARGAAGDARTH